MGMVSKIVKIDTHQSYKIQEYWLQKFLSLNIRCYMSKASRPLTPGLEAPSGLASKALLIIVKVIKICIIA